MKKKPLFAPWPFYNKAEIRAATDVLRSGKVNQWTGKEVFSFEREYARYLDVPYAVALANGSVALDLALSALGIGPGDDVIVPSRSFVASASCVALRGGTPVFADINRESQNITVETVSRVYTRRTKAIIAVHLAGWPCELAALRKFCDTKGIFLIEDCAQAHGAKYNDKPVGAWGDVSCFSFCQDKIITTAGEGGLLATNNKKIWQKVWSVKDHGRDFKIMRSRKESGRFVWAVADFGSNYRMTEMQAAIGRSMLAGLDAMVAKRRRLSDILTEGFRSLPQLRVTEPGRDFFHSYYKYYVFIRPRELATGLSRDTIVRKLQAQGIPCGSGVCPEIYREKAFVAFRKRQGRTRHPRFPVAHELGLTSLMFPVHPTLSENAMAFILKEINRLLKS